MLLDAATLICTLKSARKSRNREVGRISGHDGEVIRGVIVALEVTSTFKLLASV